MAPPRHADSLAPDYGQGRPLRLRAGGRPRLATSPRSRGPARGALRFSGPVLGRRPSALFALVSEEHKHVITETIFSAGTILSCPSCGEGLYKVSRRATTADLVLDEGTFLLPLNRDIPTRSACSTLACPWCGARLFNGGQLHTLQ